MITRKKTILLTLVMVAFAAFTIFQTVTADDLDVGDGETVTFASKRAVATPTISKDTFTKRLKSSYTPAELNIVTHDPSQGKIVHLFSGATVSSGQKFTINAQSYKGDLHLYAFHVRKRKVTRLFPKGDEFYAKNPINEYVAYNVPSDGKWLKFNSRAGKEKIYVFLFKKKNRTLAKTRSVKTLERMLAKYGKSIKSEVVKDKTEIDKDSNSGKVNSKMIAFKRGFAAKIIITNEG